MADSAVISPRHPPLLPLGAALRAAADSSDSELAAVIRADGRRRLATGANLMVADYLRAVPDLRSRPLALDAAIAVAVGGGRAANGSEPRMRRAGEERDRHPELTEAIELSLCLDRLLGPATAKADGPTSLTATDPTELGSPLEDGRPRYAVRRILGRGSNATVFEAEDRLLGAADRPSLVAIKLMRRTGDASLFERTLAEARMARSIEHPSVVCVLDVERHAKIGEVDPGDCGGCLIVQECVDGQSLDAWLAGPGLKAGLRGLIEIMRQVASALDAIHAAGLVHRDVKPANVLVPERGPVKLIDFGEAWPRDDRSYVRAASTDLLDQFGGTLAFMPPERFRVETDGGGDAPSADIFSLGAMIYFALTGVSPHGRSMVEALATLSGDRPWPNPEEGGGELRRRGVPAQLRRIIAKALAERPCERYTSAGLLGADLEAWLAHRPIEWQRPGPVRRARLLIRRRPVAVAAACLFTVLTGAGGIGWAMAAQSAAEARESQHAAEIERTRLEASQAWKQKAAEQLMRLVTKLSATKGRGLEAEVLTSLWVLEWVHGPMLLDSPDMLDTLWTGRINVLEKAVEGLRADGQGDTVTAQLMAPSLALWYLKSGHEAKAEEILESAQTFWRTRSGEHDPWMNELHALQSAARLMRIVKAAQSNPTASGPTEQAAMARELEVLKNLTAATGSSRLSGPITSLLREVMTSAQSAQRKLSGTTLIAERDVPAVMP